MTVGGVFLGVALALLSGQSFDHSIDFLFPAFLVTRKGLNDISFSVQNIHLWDASESELALQFTVRIHQNVVFPSLALYERVNAVDHVPLVNTDSYEAGTVFVLPLIEVRLHVIQLHVTGHTPGCPNGNDGWLTVTNIIRQRGWLLADRHEIRSRKSFLGVKARRHTKQ